MHKVVLNMSSDAVVGFLVHLFVYILLLFVDPGVLLGIVTLETQLRVCVSECVCV